MVCERLHVHIIASVKIACNDLEFITLIETQFDDK